MTTAARTTQRTAGLPDLGHARIAGPGEGIGLDELALATRNHGLPLEALRSDVTPPGLHYVLTHYDIPAIDPRDWRLAVTGAVDRPLTADLTALRARPSVTSRVTLECAGNGRARLDPRPVSQPWLLEAVGTAAWTGTPLAGLLAEAGGSPRAVDVVVTGADHGVERGVEQDYARALPLAEALRPDVLLAWQMDGADLPPQHGAPLRLVVPGWYGMAHVKWVTRIEVLEHPFEGFQNATAYRLQADRGDPGEPVTRIRPRALVAPPGFPDFMTRERFVRPGTVVLTGRAWSGRAPVTAVEVSTDGGHTWADADLAPADPAHPYAWRAWSSPWTAAPGRHELVVRATDEAGAQPLEQEWNRQGLANNLVQRVPVTVLEG
ncbi:sulfite oxidase [Trujillonella humicola]|uniref:sulfite oxidase n=1 Tax=Trujillonella humicola TaxID=3383699 RepID=UPI003905C459